MLRDFFYEGRRFDGFSLILLIEVVSSCHRAVGRASFVAKDFINFEIQYSELILEAHCVCFSLFVHTENEGSKKSKIQNSARLVYK